MAPDGVGGPGRNFLTRRSNSAGSMIGWPEYFADISSKGNANVIH